MRVLWGVRGSKGHVYPESTQQASKKNSDTSWTPRKGELEPAQVRMSIE